MLAVVKLWDMENHDFQCHPKCYGGSRYCGRFLAMMFVEDMVSEHAVYCHTVIFMRNISDNHLTIKHTSSTAQGGGGSFKNRKPIGEIGRCESGMAERIH